MSTPSRSIAETEAHTLQLASARWMTVQQLAARWKLARATVRGIPRDRLPYITFGSSNVRRYDPVDVEAFERTAKLGNEGAA